MLNQICTYITFDNICAVAMLVYYLIGIINGVVTFVKRTKKIIM